MVLTLTFRHDMILSCFPSQVSVFYIVLWRSYKALGHRNDITEIHQRFYGKKYFFSIDAFHQKSRCSGQTLVLPLFVNPLLNYLL